MNRYDNRAKKIGARIKEERQKMGLSVKAFLLKLFMSESSHKTVLAWERGERLPDLDSLVRMSELFECDVGYLLCDYDERTRDCADVCAVTGLDENAVSFIVDQKRSHSGFILNTLSGLISSPPMLSFLAWLSEYLCIIEELQEKLDQLEVEFEKWKQRPLISEQDKRQYYAMVHEPFEKSFDLTRRMRFDVMEHFTDLLDSMGNVKEVQKRALASGEKYKMHWSKTPTETHTDMK